jgi:Na+/H+-dicarboxylate symporter
MYSIEIHIREKGAKIMKKLSLISRVFICLVIGIGLGLFFKSINVDFPIRVLSTIGDLFKNFLSFIIPLIIIAFIVPGIASLGQKAGKGLLISALVAYVSTVIAGLLAYFIGAALIPKLLKTNSLLGESASQITSYFTVDMPPIMAVMSALVLAFVLGIGIAKLNNSIAIKLANEFNKVVLMIVENVLIPFVPIYIGCIFAKLSYAGEIFTTLKSFAIVYVILFSVQGIYLIIQFSLAGSISKQNPIKLIKNMIPAYLTAVGTQSSAATIPVTLQCTRKNNVTDEVVDFVIPLAATIHLAGDTIAITLTSMAVMYMNGQLPSFGAILPFIFMLGVTMVAAPGVPGGGIMASLGILQTMFGFGAMEQSIMIALHAAQDSFGTATNVTGDCALAVLVDEILNKQKKVTRKIEKKQREVFQG